jgi:hypothetical protein
MLNYAAAQLVNFDSIRDMILGADAKDVITVRTEREIKHKMRKCDGSGFPGTDAVVIVSRPEEKVCRASFYKSIRVDNLDSFPFGHVKDEQSCSASLSAP